ncbi:pilus assembly protein CpaF [Clostridium sp. UBA6640]|uniref:pilus assembly protein CpaF n=1 Tax=Clostridium sp. UBA6640 TaxID=1946370 RepID=UPI0025BB41E3|nr:pilus assembly protein CpaF [Clostridium sp. UBA6640]
MLKDNRDMQRYKIENVKIFIRDTIDELLKNTIEERNLTIEEYEKKKVRKEKLNQCLKRCGIGDLGAKEFVKSYIEDLITKVYGINEENINFIINFNKATSLTIQDKFEIILHHYKKRYGYNGLKILIKEYNLDTLRYWEEERMYFISHNDIELIFNKESIELCFEDKLKIITQRVYSIYKGLGVIDEIRDMRVNGLSLGVSGIPEDFLSNSQIDLSSLRSRLEYIPKSYDSIWLYYEGKEIHLNFMSFGSYKELERVCKNSYKFNNPGQFSQSDGYIFNTTADNCRVVVFRPPFCESWVCFIRKYDVDGNLKEIIKGGNAEKVIELSKYMIKGCTNISITGQQGSGKTTLLIGLVREILPTYTLRVAEKFFETHLRIKMPNRNIVTIQETPDISGDRALDVLKKTNGLVTIVGEVAEDSDVKYIVKVAQVASKFTLFTHHAKKFSDLVKSLRNSLLNINMFTNESVAEEQIISVLDFDIHLEITAEGQRYIERITECIPVEEENFSMDFQSYGNMNEKLNAFMKTTVEFFEKITMKKKYRAVNIVEYNIDKAKYEFKNSISEERIREMYKNMLKEDRESFKKFIEEFFNEEVT